MVTINGNTYALKRVELAGSYILERNGKPAWIIPDELYEDFVQIFAYAATASRYLTENPPPKDDDQKKVDITVYTPRDTRNDEEPIWP